MGTRITTTPGDRPLRAGGDPARAASTDPGAAGEPALEPILDASGASRLPYVRAIDGIRGLAVAVVLAFHGGVPGVTGGFLGVSLFFTLSGYLITQVLLGEHAETGRIALRSFWGRRLRRLAPASILCISAVSVARVATDAFPAASVRGDLLAAVGNVANWRFATASTSYADLFHSGPSPVLHFWSLAIEEQFYLAFPLLLVGVLAVFGRRGLAPVLGAVAALCVVGALFSSEKLAYYGTHARAPELLAGALLALVLPVGRQVGGRAARSIAWAGAAAGVAIVALVVAVGVEDGWLYRGGFAAFSLLSCAVLAGATVAGPLRRACSWSPLVATGKLSYGLYAYHWPLFVFLTPQRLGFGGPVLFALRIGATALVAMASHAAFEQPVRRREVLVRVPNRGLVFAGLAGVLVMAAVMPRGDGGGAEAAGPYDPGKVVAFEGGGRPAPTVDVLVLGSEEEAAARATRARIDGYRLRFHESVRPDCPIFLPDRDEGRCPSFARTARAAIAQAHPDVVIVALGTSERAALIAPQSAALGATDATEKIRLTKVVLDTGTQVVDAMLAPLGDLPVLFVDPPAPGTPADAAPDAIGTRLREATLERQAMAVTAARETAPLAEALTPLVRATGGDRLRVMVVGDSTSYEVADGLDTAAGDRIEVVWAGKHNCGVVPASRVRWFVGAEFSGAGCPSTTEVWPKVLARFRPDVVLVIDSLPEMSEQQYGDGTWVSPGEPAYVRAHDEGMAELQRLLAPTGALTVVGTAAPLVDGTAMGDGAIGEPDRLTGWLDQVARWDREWRSVGVLDWGRIVTDAEAEAGHPLREDGVHLGRGNVADLMGDRLTRELLAAVKAVRTDAATDDCRVEPTDDDGATPRLTLEHCRTTT
jgi:peptidoglycan/LPS O-acetylase OafA/YrhL